MAVADADGALDRGASSAAAKIYSKDGRFEPIPAGFQVIGPLTAEDGVFKWRAM
jgi:hypothetical protein